MKRLFTLIAFVLCMVASSTTVKADMSYKAKDVCVDMFRVTGNCVPLMVDDFAMNAESWPENDFLYDGQSFRSFLKTNKEKSSEALVWAANKLEKLCHKYTKQHYPGGDNRENMTHCLASVDLHGLLYVHGILHSKHKPSAKFAKSTYTDKTLYRYVGCMVEEFPTSVDIVTNHKEENHITLSNASAYTNEKCGIPIFGSDADDTQDSGAW